MEKIIHSLTLEFILFGYAQAQDILINSVNPNPVCAGDSIHVDFNCTSFTPTGTLSVELSDATGSFASPVVIATVASATSGVISAALPVTPQGSGYRIRITSSAPVVTGSVNGSDITVYPYLEPVFTSSLDPYCWNGGCMLLTAQPSGGTFSGEGVTDPAFCPNGLGPYNICYTYTDVFGCSGNTCQIIEVVSIPVSVITPNGSTTFCEGDSVILNATTGYETYEWYTNGAFISIDTSITLTGNNNDCNILVVVDSNGCSGISDMVCITVYPAPQPSITANGVDPLCEGDEVVLDGGQGYISYLWSPSGETTETISIYNTVCATLEVTDANGCVGITPPLCINYYPLPVLVITPSGPTEFCEGECVTFSVSNSYGCVLWSTGSTMYVTDACVEGIYIVEVCDANGCFGTASDTVIVHPLPEPTITEYGELLTCQPSFVSYEWYLNDTPIAGAFNQTYCATEFGNYTVVVTDTYGCTDISAILEHGINDPPCNIGINEIESSFKIYPNPASNSIVINGQWTMNNGHLKIMNSQGQLVQQLSNVNFPLSIDVQHLSPGIYFFSLIDGKQLINMKFVKE